MGTPLRVSLAKRFTAHPRMATDSVDRGLSPAPASLCTQQKYRKERIPRVSQPLKTRIELLPEEFPD
jgi:hypothetical protein